MKLRTGLILGLFMLSGVAWAAPGALPPDEANAPAQLSNSPRHGEFVMIKTPKDGDVSAYVVYPERKDKAPVVVVIHEIFGLSDWARAVGDTLAAEGFIAIVPDFLSGKGEGGKGTPAIAKDQVRTMMGTLDSEQVLRRLQVATDYGSKLPAANGNVGVVGYCWGGAVSFSFSTRSPTLKAAVVYYGTNPAKETLVNAKAPVLGLYGGNDARVNTTIPPAQEEMKRLGKSYEVNIYDGAGHGFLRQLDGQNGANKKAAEKAWARTLEFFREKLEIKAVSMNFDVCEDESCEEMN